MKRCYNCKVTKPFEEFHKHKRMPDGYQRMCRSCRKGYDHLHYLKAKDEQNPKRREWTVNAVNIAQENVYEYLLNHPCVDCGETDLIVLQFDHRDPKTKKYDISTMIGSGYSWATIMTEIKKCDVRCANDHLRRTARQFNWEKIQYVGLSLDQYLNNIIAKK